MTYRVFAAGDSVVWGQGLRPEQKFAEIAGGRLAADLGEKAEVERTARSGARIGVMESTNPPVPDDIVSISDHGEVPSGGPSILRQCFGDDVASVRDQVDLLCLDGGINDLGVLRILNPLFNNLTALENGIETYVYERMRTLLPVARRKFPHATIVVSGYFPIISRHSDPESARVVILARLAAMAANLASFSDAALAQAIRQSEYFGERQVYWLARAVHEFNRELLSNGLDRGEFGDNAPILFVHNAFGLRNAVSVPDDDGEAWLYGPSNEQSPGDFVANWRGNWAATLAGLEIGDPVAAERRVACDAAYDSSNTDNFLSHQICRIAAIGHPNQKGAERYADVITDRVRENRDFSLRDRLEGLWEDGDDISLRECFERYGLGQEPAGFDAIGLRAGCLHTTVDCIEVRVSTASDWYAGTGFKVFFGVGGGREWVLDHERYDDFQSGSTTRYTIDTGGELRLRDVSELSLRLESELGIADRWKFNHVTVRLNGLEVYSRSVNQTLDHQTTKWAAPDFPA